MATKQVMRSGLVPWLRVAVVMAAAVVAIVRFAMIDSGSHSLSDTLRPWLIEVAVIVVAATVVILAIGGLAARRR